MIESRFPYWPLIWMLCLRIDTQRNGNVQQIQNFTSGYNNYMTTYLLALYNKLKAN